MALDAAATMSIVLLVVAVGMAATAKASSFLKKS
jgi:hypothetical protein